ncbi:uncharacterized protein METZ01_LOCUS456290, partial [marine metagenome]
TSDLHVPNVARYQLRYAPTMGIILWSSTPHYQELNSYDLLPNNLLTVRKGYSSIH